MPAKVFQPYLKMALSIISVILSLASRGYAFLWQEIEIVPRGTLQENYDNNITYLKNQPLQDFITTLVGGALIKQEGKTHVLTIDADIAFQLFATHTLFDNVSETMSINFAQELSPYSQFTLGDSLRNASEPRGFEEAYGRTNGRYFTFDNAFVLRYHHDMDQQIAWNLHYGNDLKKYASQEIADSMLNQLNTGIDYMASSAMTLGLDYGYARRDFYPGPFSTGHKLSLCLRRYLTSQLYFDVKTGLEHLSSFSGENHIQPLYGASLTNDVDETTQGRLTFKKDCSTTAYSQDILDSWQVSLDLTKQLTDRWYAIIRMFYGTGTYVETSVQDTLSGIDVGGCWDVTRSWKLTLQCIYTRNDSSLLTYGYTKNSIALGVRGEL